MSGDRRPGRDRLVAGDGVITAECAIWNPGAPVTKQVLEVLERAGAVNIWLRDDVFDQVAREQGIRPDAWPRTTFVNRFYQFIRRRSDRPTPDLPAIFECGCSRLKVAAGRCDIYGPDGRPRV